ncbi:MAG: hypothetical protein AAF530_16630 [Pseudomonadota bacterium]
MLAVGIVGFLAGTGLPGKDALAQELSLLDTIRERGHLRCGLHGDRPALARQEEGGTWRGMEPDLCRLVAASALGDPDAVIFIPASEKESEAALLVGELDMIALAPNFLSQQSGQGARARSTALALVDGIALATGREWQVGNALQLDGQKICGRSEDELAPLRRYASRNGIEFDLAILGEGTIEARIETCAALAAQRLRLLEMLSDLPEDAQAWEILPESFSRDQWTPLVPPGDQQWYDIVRWGLFAVIQAEELGLSQADLAEGAPEPQDPRIRRLVGLEGDLGTSIGLDSQWARRAIQAVGNYGEMFARNFGATSPYSLERGPNALWNEGGLLQSPPFL